MNDELDRFHEVRLIVWAVVNLRHPQLAEAAAALGTTTWVTAVVASEVASNLESTPYVEAAVVGRL